MNHPALTSSATTACDRLWDAVSRRDEQAAAAVAFEAVDAGVDAESVLLDVIAPVQARIGAEWAANRITVAQEHAATAINDRVIAALAHRAGARPDPRLGRITVACVDKEWHVLPARLLAQVLALRGWRVDFLGAQVPTPHLIAHLHRTGPDVVALSSSIPTRLPTAHAAITACQAVGAPVLVGGAAFGPDGRYARLLGADAWAPGAREAAQLLEAGLAAPDVLAGHQLSEDLPHLKDQEYTLVARTRAQLVRAMTAKLGQYPSGTPDHGDRQRRHTAEDAADLVDFFAAALYVDDGDLFTGFLSWTADVLTARHVPAHLLRPAVDALAEELKDFPRATRILGQARLALPPSPTDPHRTEKPV